VRCPAAQRRPHSGSAGRVARFLLSRFPFLPIDSLLFVRYLNQALPSSKILARQRSASFLVPAMWKTGKTQAFPNRPPRLQSSVMALFRRYDSEQLVRATSDLTMRVQRLEVEHAALRARLEGERQLRILTAHIASAAQAAPVIGAAIERFAQAMRAPLPRGRTGGLARARTAWRYFDGTFMPESEKDATYLEEYERYAAGGRKRAASAARHSDGTFI